MTEVLETLRTVNPWLAVIALGLLSYRVGMHWYTRPGSERGVRAVFIGYVAATGLGAAQANILGSPVGPVTLLLTGLHVSLIVLMLRWQPGRPNSRRSP